MDLASLSLLIAIFLYSSKGVLTLIASISSRKKIKAIDPTKQISIIVPARNEEHNIEKCIRSFYQLKYPKDKFELIVVNDRSEDNTGKIIDDLKSEFNFLNTVHVVGDRKSPNLKGKAGALNEGISNSSGDIILMTDADCIISPEWVNEIVSVFEDSKCDFLASYTQVRSNTVFETIQEIEWVMLHTLAAAGVALGTPLGCFGNNVAITRTMYDKIGGYGNIPFSVTEDLALQLAVLRNDGKLAYRCSKESTVITDPVEDLREYIKQHHRWIVGGKALGIKGYIFVTISLSIWIAFFSNLYIGNIKNAFLIILVKALVDILILIPPMIKIRSLKKLIWFIPAELVFIIVELFAPILALKKNVNWKNQVFKT